MSSIGCNRIPHPDIGGVRKVIQLLALALGAASLAACAQSSVATKKSELLTVSQPGASNHNRKTSIMTSRPVAAKRHTPFTSNKKAPEEQVASHGLASFYTEGTQTANGETFDTHKLTAAHPTLPFGTRLRVTNVATGRSVTVRVNDRGPFVPGRVVDVSYSAAETLGMVGAGVAKVKLDVVR